MPTGSKDYKKQHYGSLVDKGGDFIGGGGAPPRRGGGGGSSGVTGSAGSVGSGVKKGAGSSSVSGGVASVAGSIASAVSSGTTSEPAKPRDPYKPNYQPYSPPSLVPGVETSFQKAISTDPKFYSPEARRERAAEEYEESRTEQIIRANVKFDRDAKPKMDKLTVPVRKETVTSREVAKANAKLESRLDRIASESRSKQQFFRKANRIQSQVNAKLYKLKPSGTPKVATVKVPKVHDEKEYRRQINDMQDTAAKIRAGKIKYDPVSSDVPTVSEAAPSPTPTKAQREAQRQADIDLAASKLVEDLDEAGMIKPSFGPTGEAVRGAVHWSLDKLTRPGAFTEAAIAKAAVDAGLIKGKTARQIEKAPSPGEAFMKGYADPDVIMGSDIGQGLFGVPQLGLPIDILTDPLSYVGGAGLVVKAGTKAAKLEEAIVKAGRAEDILSGAEYTRKLAVARRTGNFDELTNYLETAAKSKGVRVPRFTGLRGDNYRNLMDQPGRNKRFLERVRDRIDTAPQVFKSQRKLRREEGSDVVLPGGEVRLAVADAVRSGNVNRRVEPGFRIRLLSPVGKEHASIPVRFPQFIADAPIVPGKLAKFGDRSLSTTIAARQAKVNAKDTETIVDRMLELQANRQHAILDNDVEYANRLASDIRSLEDELATVRHLNEGAIARSATKNWISPQEWADRINRRIGVREPTRMTRHVGRQLEQDVQRHLKTAMHPLTKGGRDNVESILRVSLYRHHRSDTGAIHMWDEFGELTPKEKLVVANLDALDEALARHGVQAGTLNRVLDNYATRIAQRSGNVMGSSADDAAEQLRKTSMGGGLLGDPFFGRHRKQAEMASMASPVMLAEAIQMASKRGISPARARELADDWFRRGRVRLPLELMTRQIQRGRQFATGRAELDTVGVGDESIHEIVDDLNILTPTEQRAFRWDRYSADKNENILTERFDEDTGQSFIEINPAAEARLGNRFSRNPYGESPGIAERIDMLHDARRDLAVVDDALKRLDEGTQMHADLTTMKQRLEQEIEDIGVKGGELGPTPEAARAKKSALDAVKTAKERVTVAQKQYDEAEAAYIKAEAAAQRSAKRLENAKKSAGRKSKTAEKELAEAHELRVAEANRAMVRVKKEVERKRAAATKLHVKIIQLEDKRARAIAANKMAVRSDTKVVRSESGDIEFVSEYSNGKWFVTRYSIGKDGRQYSPTHFKRGFKSLTSAKSWSKKHMERLGQKAAPPRSDFLDTWAPVTREVPDPTIKIGEKTYTLSEARELENQLGKEIDRLNGEVILAQDAHAVAVRSRDAGEDIMPSGITGDKVKTARAAKAKATRKLNLARAERDAAKRRLSAAKGRATRTKNERDRAMEAVERSRVLPKEELDRFKRDNFDFAAGSGRPLHTIVDHEADKLVGRDGRHYADQPLPGSRPHIGDGRTDPYDRGAILPDTRDSEKLFFDMDPRRATFWRTRSEAIKTAFNARWKGIDEVIGKNGAEVRGGMAYDPDGRPIPVEQLSPVYGERSHEGFIGYRDNYTEVFYPNGELYFEEGMVPVAYDRATGAVERYLDPSTGREYVKPHDLDNIIGREIQDTIGEDRWWPVDTFQDIRHEMHRVGDNDYSAMFDNGMENMFLKTMSLFRFGVTTYFPAYQVRNLISDVLKSLQADSGVIFHPTSVMRIVTAAGRRGGRVPITVPGIGRVKPEEFLLMMDFFGLRSSQHLAEFAAIANGGKIPGMLRRSVANPGPLGWTGGKAVEFGARREDLMRFVTFTQRMRRNNGDVADAVWYTIKHHFDYGDLSHWERTKLRNFFLFYTWYRKNIPLQFAELIMRPGFFSGVAHFYQELPEGGTPFNFDWSAINPLLPDMSGKVPMRHYVPGYLTQQLGAAVTNWNDHAVAFATGAPWVDMNMVTNLVSNPQEASTQWFSLLNPAFTAGVQMIFNKDTLTGRDFQHFEPTDKRVWAAARYIDSIMPGGIPLIGGLFDTTTNEDGQPAIKSQLAVLVRNLPFFGRLSGYGIESTGETDSGWLARNRKLVSFLTGFNTYVVPDRSRKYDVGMQAFKAMLAERSAFSLSLSSLRDGERRNRLREYDREVILPRVRELNIPAKVLKQAEGTPFKHHDERVDRTPSIAGLSGDWTSGEGANSSPNWGNVTGGGGTPSYQLPKKSKEEPSLPQLRIPKRHAAQAKPPTRDNRNPFDTAAAFFAPNAEDRAPARSPFKEPLTEAARQLNDRPVLTKEQERTKGKPTAEQVKQIIAELPAPSGTWGDDSDFIEDIKRMAPYAIKASRATGVPASLLLAVSGQESSYGTNNGPSSADAMGEMQFIPDTRDYMINEYGVDPWKDTESAFLGGALYLKELGAIENPVDALNSYTGGYSDSEYNNPVMERAEAFKSLDKASGHVRLADTKDYTKPRPGPWQGSQSIVKELIGPEYAKKIDWKDKEDRGDPGGTLHDVGTTNAFAADISIDEGGLGTEKLVDRIAKKLGLDPSEVNYGTTGLESGIRYKGYDIEFLPYRHGSGDHVHIAAQWNGGGVNTTGDTPTGSTGSSTGSGTPTTDTSGPVLPPSLSGPRDPEREDRMSSRIEDRAALPLSGVEVLDDLQAATGTDIDPTVLDISLPEFRRPTIDVDELVEEIERSIAKRSRM